VTENEGGYKMNSDLILRMEGVSKAFPGVKALSNVDFSLCRGEVHALMGENGAGKSTLIKVLTGVYKKDSGIMKLNGEAIEPKTPQEAQKLGLSTVYQEVNLCLNLSVAENIFIGRPPKKWGLIDWKKMYKRSEEVLARLDLYIDVKQQLSSYSVAIQQMVAIARAVDISSGVLILDEPTSSLDKYEVQQLFNVMNKLKDEGMAICFVSHFLDQIYEISDRITVLRNGALVGEYRTLELPRTQLVSHMIGREWNPHELDSIKSEDAKTEEVFLSTSGLSKKGKVNPIDLSIHKGEILGLAGLLGSGRTEIARLLFGIDKADHGVVTINNDHFASMFPKKAIQNGIGFCPEDRKVEGIASELTIRENIALAIQAKRGYFPMMSVKQQRKIAEEYIEILNIKTPSAEQRIDNLSGGNQQKVILARWLATEPKLLILDEPTRGIDVNSKMEIRKLILRLAGKGISILIISAELEEMVSCCDRIIVLRDRLKIGEVSGADMSENKIMQMIAEGATLYDKTDRMGA
jgi:simple sugar transport system ATP-binding protein